MSKINIHVPYGDDTLHIVECDKSWNIWYSERKYSIPKSVASTEEDIRRISPWYIDQLNEYLGKSELISVIHKILGIDRIVDALYRNNS